MKTGVHRGQIDYDEGNSSCWGGKWVVELGYLRSMKFSIEGDYGLLIRARPVWIPGSNDAPGGNFVVCNRIERVIQISRTCEPLS